MAKEMLKTMATNEANKELARSLLEQAKLSIPEIAAQSGLSVPAVQGLKGAMVKRLASHSQAAQLKVKPTEAISKPETLIQADPEPLEGDASNHESLSTLAPSSSPIRDASPFVHIDTQSFIAFRESLPKTQQKLLDGYTILGQKTWEIQRNNGGHNNGHTYSPIDNRGDDEVNHALAELIKAKRIKLLTEDTPPQKNTESLGLKDVVEIVKLFGSQKTNEPLTMRDSIELAKFLGGSNVKETVQLVDYITKAREQGQAVTLNDISLKLEDMKQHGDLENRKLDFEVKKWEREEDKGDKTVELIKEGIKAVTSGPVGKAIENIGAGAADRLRGQGGKIPTENALCPNCGNKFKANPQLERVQCPACGVGLEHSPAPQTTEQPQPQQEPAEKPEESPDVIKKPLYDETLAMDEEVRKQYENAR